jgi:hypothetical protein
MKDTKPTPPLSRAERKIADATLAAAKFKPTSDGKSAIRTFEVHGMAVTEMVSATAATTPEQTATVTSRKAPAKEAGPQTPPLTRAGRKVADATLAAAQFVPSSDGKNAMRTFEVHGMAVTECIPAEKAITDKSRPRK